MRHGVPETEMNWDDLNRFPAVNNGTQDLLDVMPR